MAEGLAAENQLNKIEQTLRTKLAPIAPNDQFIGTLRNRLEGSTIYEKQHRLAVSMLSIAVGLVVGLVVFLVGRGFVNDGEKA
ncbi:hypothetical protein JR338_01910 [Chloroflexota bacterium]|nr:hypothetical protein JR338_01910 [Chloroflexota bacterium]